jgi:hypothetical protein
MFWVWIERLFWVARLAWGCFVTYFIASRSAIFLPYMPGNVAAWSLIIVIGWTPMLLWPTRAKIAKAAWAWCVLVCLPSIVLMLSMMTGQPFPEAMYWPLAATLACGPILRSWPIKARKMIAFGMGASVLHDRSGRKADWTFRDDGLEIAVDLVRRELRMRARNADWKPAGGEWQTGAIEMNRPLLECSLDCHAVTKSVSQTTTATATGMTSGGEFVHMTVPTGSIVVQHLTGRYHLKVQHETIRWEWRSRGVVRQADGSLHNSGYISKNRDTGNPELSIAMPDLPKRAGERLADEWSAKVAPMIAALEKTFEAELDAQHRAATEEAFLRNERATRDRWAHAKQLAHRQIDALCAEAGVSTEFLDIQYSDEGVVSWAVAADRSGRAALMDSKERWAGSLIAARAKISLELAQPAAGGTADTLQLVIELDDPEFERERLARRRFKIMRDRSRDTLLEWADRIQILSGQSAPSANAGSDHRER